MEKSCLSKPRKTSEKPIRVSQLVPVKTEDAPIQRGWQCIWLLEEQVYPTAVFCFPEVKDNITIIKDTDVRHPRLIYVVGICTSDISFTQGTVH